MGWSSQWMPVWRVWARLSVANRAMVRDTAAKWLPHQYIVKYFSCRWKENMIVNDKMLIYGPNNDVLIDQIRPFIHIHFRRTILSGPRSIKSSLSRGDILFENFIFPMFQTRNLMALGKKFESPNYGVVYNDLKWILKLFASQSPTVALVGEKYSKILTW